MKVALCAFLLLASIPIFAAPKQHSVALGKWTPIKSSTLTEDGHLALERIRPLLVDGLVKEFTTGPSHEVTDRTFVVQRVHRINDSLPQETGATRWQWEPGAWLLVDRVTGRTQAVSLQFFDPYSSPVAWYRDYAAYCGPGDDHKKVLAVVAQVGRKKPLLKKAVADVEQEGNGPQCPVPEWQRAPARVTFFPQGNQRFTFTVDNRAVDMTPEGADDSEE
jgi:hypothetical protein